MTINTDNEQSDLPHLIICNVVFSNTKNYVAHIKKIDGENKITGQEMR